MMKVTSSKKTFMRKLFIAVLCFFLMSGLACSNLDSTGIRKLAGHSEVMIPMPDGIRLSTDVYIPKSRKKCPAILVRTPYNKVAEQWMGKAFNFFNIAVVVQDVRGRYKSEGDFYPFINERTDGMTTLEWIRTQAWSDGKVAGWGGSYVGYTQWAISDSLDFMVPLLTGSNLYQFVYPDGVFSLQSALLWGLKNDSRAENSITADSIYAGMYLLPLGSADDKTLQDVDFLNDWMRHETEDEYWKQMNHRGKATCPVLSIAGWYDIFLKAQIEDFQTQPASAGKESRMIIGPWCHGQQAYKNEYGGPKKTGDPKKIFAYTMRFMKGKNPKLGKPLKDARYNLFIMERNEYAGSETWPPKETVNTHFFLGKNGTISETSAVKKDSLQYVYDPSDPFPSLGGTALGDSAGPALQNRNISRTDQLVFEVPVTDKEIILLGELNASLWLKSDAECTGFAVSVQDVFPDGKIINIQDGSSNVHFESNEPEKKEISVWATGYQVNPGHKLRIVISSSLFPRYNRNLNLCEPVFTAEKFKKATQTIYMGGDTPSYISLPVYTMNKQ